MKVEQIEIIIGSDGKVQLQTSGFSGNDCLEATKEIERLLGNQILNREETGDFFQQTPVKTAEKVKIHH